MTRTEALREAEALLKRASQLRTPMSAEIAIAHVKTAEGYIRLAKELREGS